jgi:hypothetical protein
MANQSFDRLIYFCTTSGLDGLYFAGVSTSFFSYWTLLYIRAVQTHLILDFWAGGQAVRWLDGRMEA